jgi:hypothetical protein
MPIYTRSAEIAILANRVFRDSVSEFEYHPNTDMTRSGKCHTMTRDLMAHLQSGSMSVRRELHMTLSGLWHYVLVHSPIDAPALPSDVITDLNPWYFDGGERFTGFMHATRT